MASIETPHLRLDPFDSADAEVLLAFFRDRDVRRYLLDGALVDLNWVHDEINASVARFERGGLGLFVARLCEDARLVGFTGFRPDHQPPVLEVIYALLPEFWHRGLATEMANAMLVLAFEGAGHDVVRAAVDAPNLASIRVLEGLGMTVEGDSPGAFGRMIHYLLPRASWKKKSA